MDIRDLESGKRIFDKITNRELLIDHFEKFDDLIKFFFLDNKNNLLQPMIYSVEEIENRFELLDDRNILFTAESDLICQIAESYRIQQGYLFNPTFALEISLIDILPHQLDAVYEHMLKKYPLRFLLADDAGSGKTIMAGIYIREMIQRHLLERIIIIPPAGLINNWRKELKNLFNLNFSIITSSKCIDSNPFADRNYDLLIISIDTLRQPKIFDLLKQGFHFDLAIFDEAHKLSASIESDFTYRKTKRYILGDYIANNIPNLLLLTATPHMGKDDKYYMIWRLLDNELFSSMEYFKQIDSNNKKEYILRRIKEELVTFDNEPLFKKRRSVTITYPLNQGPISEQDLYDKVTKYCQDQYNLSLQRNRGAAGLAMSVLQRRLASSTFSILKSLKRRYDKLVDLYNKLKDGRISENAILDEQNKLPQNLVIDSKTADEESEIDGLEESEKNEDEITGGTTVINVEELSIEIETVDNLINLAENVFNKEDESKFNKLLEAMNEYPEIKIIIFTEYRDTLTFLVERLESMGFTGRIAKIHGGMNYIEREEQIEFFRDVDGAKYLIATDAAGEGINLQFCWIMINYDIPWNPARLEQRMGRIHRYKQLHDVTIMNLVSKDTREGRVLEVLLEKLERIREELNTDKVFDVIGQQFSEISLIELLKTAIFKNQIEKTIQEIEDNITKDKVENILQEEKEKTRCENVREKLNYLNQLRNKGEQMRLMPAYIASLFTKMAKFLGNTLKGDTEEIFSIESISDRLENIINSYPKILRNKFTFNKKLALPEGEITPKAIYLHPGETTYDFLTLLFMEKFRDKGKIGAVFYDSKENEQYFFFLIKIPIIKEEIHKDAINAENRISKPYHEDLIGLKCYLDGRIEICAPYLLLDLIPNLKNEIELSLNHNKFYEIKENAEKFAYRYGKKTLFELKQKINQLIPEKLNQIKKAYNLREIELLRQRAKLKDNIEKGIPAAISKFHKCDKELNALERKKMETLSKIQLEKEILHLGLVSICVQAFVLPILQIEPPDSPMHSDKEVEEIAMQIAIEHEEAMGAMKIEDVSAKHSYHFDVLSTRADGEVRFIEVKGRARIGAVFLTENEWLKALNNKENYWLYVVYNCKTDNPILYIQKDPYSNLEAKPKGGVIIRADEIISKAEEI